MIYADSGRDDRSACEYGLIIPLSISIMFPEIWIAGPSCSKYR